MKLGFGSNVCRAIVRSAAGVIIEERVQHNMVLDQGRANIHGNGIFGTGSITHACAVGSSAQSITAATTQLNDEEARVVCGSRSFSSANVRESMVASFSSGQVGGKTLHTWGFSHSENAGANINTAGVFEDGGGHPSPITVPAGASLTLEYEFAIPGSQGDIFRGSQSIAISGLGTFTADWVFHADGAGGYYLSDLMALGGGHTFYGEFRGGKYEGTASVQADGPYGIKIVFGSITVPTTESFERFVLRWRDPSRPSSTGEVVWNYSIPSAQRPTVPAGSVIALGNAAISW